MGGSPVADGVSRGNTAAGRTTCTSERTYVDSRPAVHVMRGGRIEDIRQKCRDVSARAFLDVLDRIHGGRLDRSPQMNADGRMFYRMGRHLRHKVDAVLIEQQHAHYV